MNKKLDHNVFLAFAVVKKKNQLGSLLRSSSAQASPSPVFTSGFVCASVHAALQYSLFAFLQIIKQVGFAGNFKEFLDMLRTNKRFYYDTKVNINFIIIIIINIILFLCYYI